MNEDTTGVIDLNTINFEELSSLQQIIPQEMMAAIRESAEAKGISIDDEISTRLLATFIEPQAFGINIRLNKLLNQKFLATQAKTEAELRRKGWLCVYEIDKLKILLMLKDKLPKNFKETFSLIDVEKESVRILAELAEENNNEGNSD